MCQVWQRRSSHSEQAPLERSNGHWNGVDAGADLSERTWVSSLTCIEKGEQVHLVALRYLHDEVIVPNGCTLLRRIG